MEAVDGMEAVGAGVDGTATRGTTTGAAADGTTLGVVRAQVGVGADLVGDGEQRRSWLRPSSEAGAADHTKTSFQVSLPA